MMREIFMDHRKPAWWQLYLLGACAMGLIVLAHLWKVSEALHGTANIAIVLTGYGAFNMWLSFNGEALERLEEAEEEAARGKAPAVSNEQAHYRHLMRVQELLKVSSAQRERD
jgi:hypothetical protein